jgi:hypothetical protein
MNRGFEGMACLFGSYCVAAAVAVTSLLTIARGQETLPAPPPGYRTIDQESAADRPICPGEVCPSQLVERATRALTAEFGNGLMFRVTMPHPGQLLQGTCTGPTCCEEMLERLGAGLEQHAASEFPYSRRTIVLNRFSLRPGEVIDARALRNSDRRFKGTEFGLETEEEQATGHAGFIRLGCPSTDVGECHCARETSCGTECAAATATDHCTGCQCCACAAKSEEARCGDENCELATLVIQAAAHQDDAAQRDPLKLMQHIAGLMAEKAAAEAALEVKSESRAETAELYEAMAELMADNAALDAKLQARAEHDKLIEKLATLAAENARLSAHVQFAAERAEHAKSELALAIENEHLKVRLANLEEKQALAEAARTATKQRGERKAR